MEDIVDPLRENGIQGVTSETSQQSPTECDDLDKTTFQGKYHKQSYRKAWESLPDFQGWLSGVDGEPNRAFCSYCKVSLFAHRLGLLKHTCTLKHQRATQTALLKSNGSKQKSPDDSMVPIPSSLQRISTENIKLNLRPIKSDHNASSNMTVTIIQERSEEPIELQLDQNITERENTTLIADDDDLGLNTFQSVQCNEDQVAGSETSSLASKPMSMARLTSYPLSTHVLDTSKGQPVPQIPVSLYRLVDGRWTLVGESVTNQDGRCIELVELQEFVAGRYKLHFDTHRYFELDNKETLYPFVEIAFDIHAPRQHYHIPLLLSAFGYSTYRGS